MSALVKQKQLARVLGVSEGTVIRWRKSGVIRAAAHRPGMVLYDIELVRRDLLVDAKKKHEAESTEE